MLQMTWPGAPTLYYGDEAGLCGFTDPDSRRTYPWERENRELLQFYRSVIKMHRSCPVLRKGSLKMLCAGKNLLVYGRFNEEEQVIVAINQGCEEKDVELPIWETGLSRTEEAATLIEIFRTDHTGFYEKEREHTAVAGILAVRLLPQSAYVFLHRENVQSEKMVTGYGQ